MINKKNTREPSSVLFSNIVTNGIFQTLQEIKKQGGHNSYFDIFTLIPD